MVEPEFRMSDQELIDSVNWNNYDRTLRIAELFVEILTFSYQLAYDV